MDLGLSGKTALVTGGSRGIGYAIAMTLAEEGCDVAIVARTEVVLSRSASAIGSRTGRRVLPIVADTSDSASVKRMATVALDTFGKIDILVNCAARPGGAPPQPGIENLPDELFASEMNTKVLGYARTVRELVPSMKASGWGRIINISGLAARQTGNAIGSMRNVAISALTKNLADELGPFGINVTCVHPGMTWTEGPEPGFLAGLARPGESEGELKQRLGNQNVIHRLIDADDIAALVAFLASPRSIAITGDSIAAGGGIARAIHY